MLPFVPFYTERAFPNTDLREAGTSLFPRLCREDEGFLHLRNLKI